MVFKFPYKQTYWINGRRHTSRWEHSEDNCTTVHSKMKQFNDKMNKLKLKSDTLRETLAEFLGTFLLVLIGNSGTAALTFSEAKNVSSVAGPLVWGLALLIAICVTGGVSGCHANPAVSLAFASVGKLKWKKIPPYFCAQYAGGFVSAIIVYAVYFDSFEYFDGGLKSLPPSENSTAHIFATYPAAHVSVAAALGDTIVSTMVLMLAIISITDPHNMQVLKGSYPLLIGLSLSGVIFAFPYSCGAPLNPARDLAPRLFTLIAGWGVEVFSFHGYGYFWIPIVGTHIGAILGAWLYKMCIEIHWPVDSYDFENPTEVKTNGEFKKQDEPNFEKLKMSNQSRKPEE